jgi:hypothetical protein
MDARDDMLGAARCPKCQEPVTIPEGVAAEAAVRCPLCQDEYPLSEALAGLPPALVPVATSTDEAPAEAAGDAVEGAPMAAENVTEAEEDQAVDWDAVLGIAPKGGQPSEADRNRDAAKESEDAGKSGTDEGGTPAAEDEAAAKNRPAAPAPARRRGRSRRQNPLRELIGAIFGGFLGLAIGYYLLNWIGGPRFDFVHVYLPGVPHTYKYWTSSEQPAEENSPASAEKPASLRPRGPSTDGQSPGGAVIAAVDCSAAETSGRIPACT